MAAPTSLIKTCLCDQDISKQYNPYMIRNSIAYIMRIPKTAVNARVRSQHCGYWCPDAKAPCHQWHSSDYISIELGLFHVEMLLLHLL